MPITEKHTTLGQSTLASSYTAGAGSMVVTSAASFPATGYFSIRTNAAAVYTVTAVSGTTFTVVLESGSDVNLAGGVNVVEVQTQRSVDAMRGEGPGPYDRLGFQAYSGLAWINQGSASGENNGGRLTITETANNDFNWRILKKSLSAPVTFTCWFVAQIFKTDYQRVGICMRESGTGKLAVIMVYGSQDRNIRVERWTGPSGAGALGATVYDNATNHQHLHFTFGIWFRIEYDNTDIKYSISPDGKLWYQVYTEAKTVPFTTAPDELGVCVLSGNGNAFPAGITVLSWVEA